MLIPKDLMRTATYNQIVTTYDFLKDKIDLHQVAKDIVKARAIVQNHFLIFGIGMGCAAIGAYLTHKSVRKKNESFEDRCTLGLSVAAFIGGVFTAIRYFSHAKVALGELNRCVNVLTKAAL